MKVRDWRKLKNLTLVQAGAALQPILGEPMHSRTWHRYEIGATQVPTHIAEAVRILTSGAVTPNDFHEARKEYLAAKGEFPRLPVCAAE